MSQCLEELKELAKASRQAADTLLAEADHCTGGHVHQDVKDIVQFLDNREASYLCEARAIEQEGAERDQQIAELTAILIEGPVSYPGIARTVWDAGWRPPE